jgi:hypothetical protein
MFAGVDGGLIETDASDLQGTGWQTASVAPRIPPVVKQQPPLVGAAPAAAADAGSGLRPPRGGDSGDDGSVVDISDTSTVVADYMMSKVKASAERQKFIGASLARRTSRCPCCCCCSCCSCCSCWPPLPPPAPEWECAAGVAVLADRMVEMDAVPSVQAQMHRLDGIGTACETSDRVFKARPRAAWRGPNSPFGPPCHAAGGELQRGQQIGAVGRPAEPHRHGVH